jgi:hypothetical protein
VRIGRVLTVAGVMALYEGAQALARAGVQLWYDARTREAKRLSKRDKALDKLAHRLEVIAHAVAQLQTLEAARQADAAEPRPVESDDDE